MNQTAFHTLTFPLPLMFFFKCVVHVFMCKVCFCDRLMWRRLSVISLAQVTFTATRV